jgi:hypothetical protein
MKPAWDKLMTEFAGSKDALVADVDCTAEGKDLCSEHGVQGFPTIKYGDPSNMEDYQGGRDYESLKAFADENLKPMCSPSNIELCDDEARAEIEKYSSMSSEELDGIISEGEKGLQDAADTFDSELKKLQANYEKLVEDKEASIAAVKASGLSMAKAVKAAA